MAFVVKNKGYLHAMWAGSMATALTACGGQTSSNSSGDGAAGDHITRLPDGGRDSDSGVAQLDAGTDAPASDAEGDAGKPPYDGGSFASCFLTNPCGRGQVCENFVPTGQTGADAGIVYADCESIPATCEPDLTCFCLLEMAECSNRLCSDEGGVPVLTCSISPHP